MSWNTRNSQDFLLVDKNLPPQCPVPSPSRDGAFAFSLRPSGSIYTQLLQNDALSPGADTHAAKHRENEGRKHTKEGDFRSNQGKK